MTLITRIFGKKRTFIAADSQINDLQGYPYHLNGKIVKRQKLFEFDNLNLILGFSGTLSIKESGYFLIEVCNEFFENFQGDNNDLLKELILHLKQLKLTEKISGSSIIMITANLNNLIQSCTIKINKSDISIIVKPGDTKLIHDSTIYFYCKENNIDYSEFLTNFCLSNIKECFDFNFDYGDNNLDDINNHPILIYTILCITAYEQKMKLKADFLDNLSDSEILSFISCFYENILRLRDNRNIIRDRIGVLYTIGDLAYYAIVKNGEIYFEIYER